MDPNSTRICKRDKCSVWAYRIETNFRPLHGRHMKNARQHIVPRFYLSEWLEAGPPEGQDPAIWRIPKSRSNPFRRAPHKTFVETDRYTVRLPSGDRDLRVEHQLDEIERDFARVLRRLQKRDKLTLTDKGTIATFTAAMLGRTQRRADHWRDAWTDIRGIVERFELKRPSRSAGSTRAHAGPRDPEAVNVSTEEIDSLLLNVYPDFLVNCIEAAAPILFAMDLSIYSTEDDIGFLTSDDPCIMHDLTAYRYHPMTRSAGLKNRNVQVTLPISPKLLIAFTHRQTYPFITPLPIPVVDSFNRMMVWHSNREVISRSDTVREAWFAAPGPLPPDAWENRPREKADIFTPIARPETIDI